MGKPLDADTVKKTSKNSGHFAGKPGPGRPKGVPNKATTDFKMTVTRLLEGNADNVAVWLKTVAEGDPKAEIEPDPYKALDMLAKLAEYATPKLARQEHVGDGGGAMKFELSAPWLEQIVRERGL